MQLNGKPPLGSILNICPPQKKHHVDLLWGIQLFLVDFYQLLALNSPPHSYWSRISNRLLPGSDWTHQRWEHRPQSKMQGSPTGDFGSRAPNCMAASFLRTGLQSVTLPSISLVFLLWVLHAKAPPTYSPQGHFPQQISSLSSSVLESASQMTQTNTMHKW